MIVAATAPMRHRLRLAGLIGPTCLSALSATAQVADADRFIKLGTRLPLMEPGEGGQVRVRAWPELCKDDRYIVEVRLVVRPGENVPLLNIRSDSPGVLPVVRLPAGPSPCDWTFDDLPEGLYSASLQRRGSERVIATAGGTLTRGASLLMTLESAEATVEGRITLKHGEPPVALRLAFKTWTTMTTP